jgi:uncharacterized MAPEG superfamily protein
MTTPFWCLLIIVVLPFVLAGTGSFFRNKQLGNVDNDDPREQVKQLTGAGARAYAAQQNAWEALAMFTPAVITAHVFGADAGMSATLAMVFVACRALHPVCYIAGWSLPRSLSFMGAMVCVVWLFVLAA